MQKYAFLDRDGTFLWEPPRPAEVDPRETFPLQSLDEFKFMDGAMEGLKVLKAKGYKLVMVTNQTFLGTPQHPLPLFNIIMEKIDTELAKEGLSFEFKMVCPHGPDDDCECRKPRIGGLKQFLIEHADDIDLAHSVMFGDRVTDEEFAHNLGVKFIKIDTNKRFQVPPGL